MINNKRGQTDIITYIVVIIGLLILAPIMLKFSNEILTPFQEKVNETSTSAGEAVSTIHTSFVTFWDKVIAIAFMINVLMLFVFAFLAGPHPIFAVFYLISSAITLMFSRYVMAPVTTIFGMGEFQVEVLQLPITNFIVTRFDIILLGIIVVTGIIMYSSFKREGGFSR